MNSLLTAALLTLTAAAAPAPEGEDAIKSSVVQFFTVTKEPDYYEPWKLSFQQNLSGSGVILPGNRILTNAHVVSDQVFVQVRKSGDDRKYTAKVEFVAHDCEAALVSVEDPAFFEGTVPAKLGSLPFQRDKVAAYGFPLGGDQLSITEGVVSRIEVNGYTHSGRRLLLIQTDAAINSGNSGGPVFKDGRLIGISFQSYAGSEAENIGYIVPVTLIERFLADVKDGRYDGVPALGVHVQKTASAALRAYAGIPPKKSGVLVSRVLFGSPAWGLLEEGDVLTALDGVAIQSDGTFPFRKDERLELSHLVNLHQMGEAVAVELLRRGVPMTVPVRLSPFEPLVPGPHYDRRPSYFIHGGLVFTPLTRNFLNLWKRESQDPRFRHYADNGLPTPERRQVVLLKQVLPHEANVGYHRVQQAVVQRVNGRPVGDMKDLVAAFAAPQGRWQVVEVDAHSDAEEPATRVVLDAEAAAAAGPAILKRFDIPADRSPDLR